MMSMVRSGEGRKGGDESGEVPKTQRMSGLSQANICSEKRKHKEGGWSQVSLL